VIEAFKERGRDVLRPGSHHPGGVSNAFATPRAEARRALRHHSPRRFGQAPRLGTLELAAAAEEQGLSAQRVSGVTIRHTGARRGVRWRRAKEQRGSPALTPRRCATQLGATV
jgi:hypothetical protein